MATMTTAAAARTTPGCGCGCGGSTGGCGCGGSCGSCSCATLEQFERPRFFSGQLLTEQELNGEQRYVVDKNRLHNRLLHGFGVVCGLRVSCCDATRVTVESGYALDPCGNDIVLPCSTTIDILQLIRDCRNRMQAATDCNPFMATQLTGCEGADQTWCLTITYAEQDARPVAALRSSAGAPTSAATTPGCGCGCNGNGKSTTASTAVDSVGRTATACEPTRVVETATFGVACMPQASYSTAKPSELDAAHQTLSTQAPADTFMGDVLRCQADFVVVLEAKPELANLAPQEAFTLLCRWLAQAKSALAAHPTTHCGTVTKLAEVVVPAPGPNTNSATYLAQLETIEAEIVRLVDAAALECLCWNLIPSCPDPPQDTCVVLACITLRNDVIVDICLGWPRRQVISFPTLAYWLTGLASTSTGWTNQLPTLLSPEAFGRVVSLLCCGRREVPGTAEASRFYAVADLGTSAPPKEAVSGISQAEFQRLRTGVSTARDAAVRVLRFGR